MALCVAFISLSFPSTVEASTTISTRILAFGVSGTQESSQGDSLATGKLHVRFADIDTFLVVVDQDFSHYITVTQGDSVITLPTGPRHLTFASRVAYDAELSVEVVADSLISVRAPRNMSWSQTVFPMRSSFLRLLWNATLAIHTDSDALIFVDGEPVGTGRALLNLPEGKYDIAVEHPQLGRKRKTVSVRESRLLPVDVYLRPDPFVMSAATILPGGGHFHRGESVRGTFALASVSGALAGALVSQIGSQVARRDFEDMYWRYQTATTEQEALTFGNRAESLSSNEHTYRQIRNGFLILASGLYVWQMIDGRRHPDHGYRVKVDRRYLFAPTIDGDGIQLGLHYSF